MTQKGRAFAVIFALSFAPGCGAAVTRGGNTLSATGASPSLTTDDRAASSSESPLHDTMAEYRRGERVACASGTDLIYVISHEGQLYSFDPHVALSAKPAAGSAASSATNAAAFTRIGSVTCPDLDPALTHSMAVDRMGRAWVGFSNGAIALVDIHDASCTRSEVALHRAGIATSFGMGFAPTKEGAIGGESLFLSLEPDAVEGDEALDHDTFTSKLARVDDGKTVHIVGEYPTPVRHLRGELTSRSDGRLFGFFTGDPFLLAEIDPATAELRWQRTLGSMRFSELGGGSWAFAAVGSETFFFWTDQGGPSRVTHLSSDGVLTTLVNNSGIEVVGAGVSTCATMAGRSPSSPRAAAFVPPTVREAPAQPQPTAQPSKPRKSPPKPANKPGPSRVEPVKKSRRRPSVLWWWM